MKKALVLPLLFMLFVSPGEASKQSSVNRLRYSSYENHTRVVVDLNGPVVFKKERIPGPDRIFFDIEKCVLSGKIKASIPIMDGRLKAVRISQYNENTVRVVLDIDKLSRYSAFTLEYPDRLVIDVYYEVASAPNMEPVAGPNKEPAIDPNQETAKAPDSVPDKEITESPKAQMDKNQHKIGTIVIDAGHGGKDPGAIGPGGLQEKDITLYVGMKLGGLLAEKHGVNIIYTRDKDIFVPLNDRTEIANSSKADLFVSIHVNASERKTLRGIETYFLNWTNDREAMRVAARENKISLNKMEKMQDGVQVILQDLARNNKREESMRLAHSVQNSMISTLRNDYTKIEDLGVKYAMFYVLVGAEMPSILVEISFISNHEEEQRLAAIGFRDKVAEAIAKGIDVYISQATLIVAGRDASGG